MKRKLVLGLVGVLAFGCMGVKGAEVENLTLSNLQKSYQAESSSKARFDAFAAQADKEGFKAVATLFRAASKSESIHADKHAAMITKLGVTPSWIAPKLEVKTTKENLEVAIQAKAADKDGFYPGFIKQAKADKNHGAEMSFMGASASSGGLVDLFKTALSNLDNWKVGDKAFGVCTVCGWVVMGALPAKCPICDSPKDKFVLVK